MKLIFAGTPEFARVALQALHGAGHDIALVLTQPDRSAGRGMKLQASAVKQYALDHSLALAQPRSLRLDGKYPEEAQTARTLMVATQADAMVVAAYGLMLPQWVLDLPAQGCFNIHASLLPRWRGAAPIHRAIEAGDAQTGVTIMQMDAGLDTGAMLLVQALPILDTDTTGSLHDRLAALGGQLMLQALEQASRGTLRSMAQPEAGVCYAHKIEKAESAIDWTQSAQRIAQRARAFDPFPGVTAVLSGDVLKIWRLTALAQTPPANVAAGTVLSVAPDGITVATGDGVAQLTELQKPGGKRLPVADFLRGYELQVGTVFDPRTA